MAADGLDAEKPFAVSVLVSTAIGWNRLTDAERESLFLSSNPSTWRWAALALAKNGRREQLMEWTRERPADDHLDVIWVLKHNKPKDWSDQELAFWLACTRHNPGGVAYVLRLWDGPTPAPLREPIRSYLKSEIAKPTIKDGGTHSEGYLFAAVYLLDSWGDADDTPLLLDYLKHAVHSTLTRYEGAAGTMIRYYGLRDHVRALLEGRGVKIPSGVVYKEEVGPGKE